MTPTFALTFRVSNSAFSEGNLRDEVVRILRETADKVAGGRDGGAVHDVNGNNVGEFYLDEEE